MGSVLLVIAGIWLILQAVGGDLARRLRSWSLGAPQ